MDTEASHRIGPTPPRPTALLYAAVSTLSCEKFQILNVNLYTDSEQKWGALGPQQKKKQ